MQADPVRNPRIVDNLSIVPVTHSGGSCRARRSAPMATYVNVPSVTFTVPLSSWRRAQASTSTVTLVTPTFEIAQ
jgi:hypothetical protein